MNNISLGIKGENLAVKLLKKNKYKILDRNYRCPLGEIDIVAMKNNVLHIVEVKTRQSAKFGLPREAVDENKQRKLQILSLHYQKAKKMFDFPVAYTVVEILGDKITLIENAFY